MKKFCIFLLLFISHYHVVAQELMANVQVTAPQVPNMDKRNLEQLQKVIRDFLNNNKWTQDVYQPQERIVCNLTITILSWDGNANYRAEAQIQSNRPVYGTGYYTTLLNYNDREFDFNYIDGQPLDFSEQNYLNSLSSLLGYYAYTIIGLDKDSFALHGGTPQYLSALTVLNYSQNTGTKGWKAGEGLRNRFWLNQNLLDNNYKDFREFIYQYHRNGLDVIQANNNQAPRILLNILPALQKLDKQKMGAIFPNIYLSAKSDEVVNFLKLGNPQEKIRGFNLMSEVDPANQSKYQSLIQQ